MNHYIEANFYKTTIGVFEVDVDYKTFLRNSISEKVIVNDTFDELKALEFKNKYSQNITGRYFLTK